MVRSSRKQQSSSGANLEKFNTSKQSIESPTPSHSRYLPLLWWIILIAVLYSLIGLASGDIGVKTCPDTISGPDRTSANLTIAYFGNPFCVYCWIQDPMMERLVQRHSSVLRYEHYDNRYCTNETTRYGIIGTPGFSFILPDGKTVTHVGYLEENYLSQVICETTGSCDGNAETTLKTGPRP